MLIVSQDKKTIIDEIKLNIRNIGEYSEGFTIYEMITNKDMGTYATEERAKEVLQEIVKCYEKTETYKVADEEGKFYIAENNIIFKYEMPEE